MIAAILIQPAEYHTTMPAWFKGFWACMLNGDICTSLRGTLCISRLASFLSWNAPVLPTCKLSAGDRRSTSLLPNGPRKGGGRGFVIQR